MRTRNAIEEAKAKHDPRKRWAQAEVRAQEQLIDLMLDGFASRAQVERALADRHGVKRSRAQALYARVLERRDRELEADRAHHRTKQVLSLERSVAQIESVIGEQLRHFNDAARQGNRKAKAPAASLYREKRELIDLISELTGTRAPLVVQHKVDASQAVMLAISMMADHELAALEAEEEAEHGLLAAGSLVVDGEETAAE